jgi:quercetin dioxygenase-like cupin family protein
MNEKMNEEENGRMRELEKKRKSKEEFSKMNLKKVERKPHQSVERNPNQSVLKFLFSDGGSLNKHSHKSHTLKAIDIRSTGKLDVGAKNKRLLRAHG